MLLLLHSVGGIQDSIFQHQDQDSKD